MIEIGTKPPIKLDYNTHKNRLTFIIRETKIKYYIDQIDKIVDTKFF